MENWVDVTTWGHKVVAAWVRRHSLGTTWLCNYLIMIKVKTTQARDPTVLQVITQLTTGDQKVIWMDVGTWSGGNSSKSCSGLQVIVLQVITQLTTGDQKVIWMDVGTWSGGNSVVYEWLNGELIYFTGSHGMGRLQCVRGQQFIGGGGDMWWVDIGEGTTWLLLYMQSPSWPWVEFKSKWSQASVQNRELIWPQVVISWPERVWG
jgi:hypothetical protein